jgi:hypothetical protein
MSTDFTAIAKVMIPKIRRTMPSIIASEIIGVSPMTGPTASIYALRARYSAFTDGCSGIDCGFGPDMSPTYGVIYATCVDFPMNHPLRNDPQAVVTWALQNCRKSFTYSTVVIGTTMNPPETDERIMKIRPANRVWRWTFADEDDAFGFKVRWM